MNALRVVSVLAASAMLFAACGNSDDDPGETADPATPTATEGTTDQPAVAGNPDSSQGSDDVVADGHDQDTPLPVLTVSFGDGASGEAAPGTRCWGAMCIDMVGPVTPVEPVVTSAGVPVTFDVAYDSQPESGTVAWVPATEQWPQSEYEGTVAWQAFPDGVSSSLDGITVPTEPGDYVMIVSTLFAEGDISFGLLVRVE